MRRCTAIFCLLCGLCVVAAAAFRAADAVGPALEIPEDKPVGSIVGRFSTEDPDAGDTHTYNLVPGEGDTDNAAFAIDGDRLKTAAALDHAAKPLLSVRVRTTDQGGLWLEKAFQIAVLHVNRAPANITLTPVAALKRPVPAGTKVAAIRVLDPDADDAHVVEMAPKSGGPWGQDNASFAVRGDGLFAAAELARPVYHIRLRATDAGGLSVEQRYGVGLP